MEALLIKHMTKISQFNRPFLNDIHPSWLNDLSHMDHVKLVASVDKRLIWDHLLHDLMIDKEWYVDFFNQRRHLYLLITSPYLQQILMYLGLITLSKEIRSIISGEMLQKFSSSIGEQAYDFVRQHAAFWNAGALEPYIDDKLLDESLQNPNNNIVLMSLSRGSCLLGKLYMSDPEPIKKKLAVKLPSSLSSYILKPMKHSQEEIEQAQHTLIVIIDKLINYINPDILPCTK